MKFKLGRSVMTSGIAAAQKQNTEFALFVSNCFRKYTQGDWGDLHENDKQMNDEAVEHDNDRIHGSYDFDKDYDVQNQYGGKENKIWIITEWDRSVTTVLFPGEY